MGGILYLQSSEAGRILQLDPLHLEPSGARQGKESLQGRTS